MASDVVSTAGPTWIVLSIPAFFALMAIEVVVSQWILRRPVYRLGDAIANLSCGVLEQLLVVFLKGLLIFPYVALFGWASARGWTLTWPEGWGWAQIVVAFLGVDLCYYVYHRMSHEVYVFWAGHVVHHQSEDYNLSVALRQGGLSDLVGIPFYLPLIFLGISPPLFVAAKAVMILYQFWIHTELVPKLGWIEAVFNTPSHHRVHHGINPEYIDKNYAGSLIIWDRLFGTFEPEGRPVVYGIVKPLRTYNVFWANLHVLVEIAALRDPRAWFARPGWRPARLGGPVFPPEVVRGTFQKFEPGFARRERVALCAVFGATLLLTAVYLLGFSMLTGAAVPVGALLIVGGLVVSARLMRDRRDGRGDRA